jgi:molybdate transport system substrate-binding protein
MKPRSLVRFLSMIGVAVLSTAGTASAADVQVMIPAGFHGAYSELGPAFERASGHHLITIRGPSMGGSPEVIPARLTRGEPADVVILDGKLRPSRV